MIGFDDDIWYLVAAGMGLFVGALGAEILTLGSTTDLNLHFALGLLGMCTAIYMNWEFNQKAQLHIWSRLGWDRKDLVKQYKNRKIPTIMKVLFIICIVSASAHLFYQLVGVL